MPATLSLPSIASDAEISHLWIEGRLKRQSAHAELKTFVTMIGRVFGEGMMNRSRLPDTLCVRPLLSYELREQSPDGIVLVDTRNSGPRGRRTPVFGPGFRFQDLLFMLLVLDRCSTGSSGFMYAITRGAMLWTLAWGVRHDVHNAIKNGCKRPGTKSAGIVNKAIIRFAALANMRQGPVRSMGLQDEGAPHAARRAARC